MATLTVWKFNTPEGAEQAVATLESLQKQGLIKVHDAATVTWPADKKKPRTRQLASTTGAGALGGAFWGLLFGLLFFIPLIGLAVGAAGGALAGSLADVGIDDDFIASVRTKITPGTSALFVMTSDAVVDKVHEAFAGTEMELIQTNLSNEEEAKLREAFQED
ncbi:MAG: DUF1269 domain-containing protein [Acidimicrobiales bacterium]